MTARISYAERHRIFGRPCVEQNMVTVMTPWGMRARVHKLIAPLFLDACHHAAADVPEWRPQRCDSYVCRKIRGGTDHSLHSYGLAHDWFATPPNVPPPGGVWTPDNGVPISFARPFLERGFTWGATFERIDVPHIEWCGGRPPHRPSPIPVRQPLTLTRTDSYEVDMVINDYTLPIATDENGNGWDVVPFARSRIIGHTPPGLRPGVDGRYLVGQVGFADDPQGTVVSVTEWAPNEHATVTLSVRN